MVIWKATIKERGWESLLTPIYAVPEDGKHDHIDENFLIDFWGLNEPDVEWYKLEMTMEKNNEVTNFLYYMYNKWCIGEAKKVFGDNLGEHIFSKWVHQRSRLGDLYLYSELDDVCRNKIVARANEIYNK